MARLLPVLPTLLLLTACQLTPVDASMRSVSGAGLDITRLDLERSIADLNGMWAFKFGVSEAECASIQPTPESRFVSTPSYWSGYSEPNAAIPPVGQACYALKIKMNPAAAAASHLTLYVNDVSAASAFFWNGQRIGSKGKLGSTRTQEHGHIGDASFIVPSEFLRSDNVLAVAVSNHTLRGGGINNEIFLGASKLLTERRILFRMIDFFLLGSIIMAGIYYLALWLGRPQQKAYLWFFLMCLVISLRLLSSGSYFEELIANPQWMTAMRMHVEYLTAFSLDAIAFAFFLKYLFPSINTKVARVVILIMGALPGLIVIGTRDAVFYGRFQPLFSAMLAIGLTCSMYIFVLAVVRREVGARFTFASFLILFAAALHDLIMTSRVENVRLFAPFGVFIFIYGMAAALGRQFNQVHRDLEILSESYARFVPREFLQHLNKTRIIDVRLGDNTIRTMSVLFSDIREFTRISESLTPEGVLDFLNKYLDRISDSIRTNHGFVDKYVGDAIMALFDGPPANAVQAAVDMVRTIRRFNAERGEGGRPVQIGIGINTGELILGTVGSALRMDTTVIGDTVNIASRVEALTKQYGAPVIISAQTQKLLPDVRFLTRKIDSVVLRGKEIPIDLYEVFDCDEEETREKKRQSIESFNEARVLYKIMKWQEAGALFHAIAKDNPGDNVARVYARLCGEYHENPPARWSGVTDYTLPA